MHNPVCWAAQRRAQRQLGQDEGLQWRRRRQIQHILGSAAWPWLGSRLTGGGGGGATTATTTTPISLHTARKGPVQLQAPGYIVLLTRALTVNLGQRRDQALGGVGTDRATFTAVTASRVALSPAGWWRGKTSCRRRLCRWIKAVDSDSSPTAAPPPASPSVKRSDSC